MNPTSLEALSLSPVEADHGQLTRMLAGCPVTLHHAAALPSAMSILTRERISVVICEAELPPFDWKDLLEAVQSLRPQPLVIVTSRLADDRLWAEALNLGAHDVLAKPFDATEVSRVVGSALVPREGRVHAAGRG